MSRIWTIARRELKGLFDHPTAYILIVVFLAVNNFFFFRQAYLSGAAEVRPMMDLLPWLFLFFVPAVAMGSLAEDSRSGTLEVVLAQPVSEFELLLGKYLGVVLFVWIALACTFAIPIGLSLGADLHAGVVIAQYVGAALFSAGLAAVGLWASSLSQNQITAFIIGVAVMFLLVLLGMNPQLVGLSPSLGTFAARLSVLSHFTNIARGVIDLRDVIYFVSLGTVFLVLGYGALMARKLSREGATLKRLRGGVIALVAASIVVNLLGGYIGGRLDLTPGKTYSLSRTTKRMVRDLGDYVTIKVFASKDLPPEFSFTKRDLDDFLSDLRTASGGNVRIVERDPLDDEEAADEARSLGIGPVQFNVMSQSQLRIQEGYMGLAVQYAERTETIPFVRRTDDLEYRIMSFIRSLADTSKRTVGLAQPPAGPQGGRSFSNFREQLGQLYDVRSVSYTTSTSLPEGIEVLVLAGTPDSLSDSLRTAITDFLAHGGSALVAARGMTIDPNPQFPMAMAKRVLWNELLEPYGVSIASDMVYDLASNERVQMPTQFGRLLMQYPYWVRAVTTSAGSINADVQSLLLPWPSSIDTTKAVPGSVTPLYLTTEAAGRSVGTAMIDPSQEFSRDSLQLRVLGVQVTPPAEGDGAGRGRLVVVGSEDVLADNFLAPENMAFALNAVDWLAQDEALVRIRSKDRRPPPLAFGSPFTRDAVKYGNLMGIPILVVIGAVVRLVRRRRTTKLTYVRRALATGGDA